MCSSSADVSSTLLGSITDVLKIHETRIEWALNAHDILYVYDPRAEGRGRGAWWAYTLDRDLRSSLGAQQSCQAHHAY